MVKTSPIYLKFLMELPDSYYFVRFEIGAVFEAQKIWEQRAFLSKQILELFIKFLIVDMLYR